MKNENNSITKKYLSSIAIEDVDPGAIAFYASIDKIRETSPKIARDIVRELQSQRSNIKLIASENYSSLATQLAQGNLLTDKYAEGFPGHRFYAGCDNIDSIENEAIELAKQLFGADHAYVQPHSGADANLVAFVSILAKTVESPALEKLRVKSPVTIDRQDWEEIRTALRKQRLLAMDFRSGGHLSHGYRFNFSSRLFDAYLYQVDPETKLLDLDALRKQAHEVKPNILLAGYSAYSRKINFAKMREIADEVGAVLMVDMAHFAGLVAGGVFTGDYNPVPFAHIVTTTTHKTLRGPRGGMILCQKEFAEFVNKGCPAILGGPLPHVMAAKAVALREASQPEFKEYAHKIVDNAQILATELQQRNIRVLTGGTDNHLVLCDVKSTFDITGLQAEYALRACGLTLNRNALPYDTIGPLYTSGIRLGTAAITTLGMGREGVTEIADIISDVLHNTKSVRNPASPKEAKTAYVIDADTQKRAQSRTKDLLSRYMIYPEIDLELLMSAEVDN